jgi:hypothetical protein
VTVSVVLALVILSGPTTSPIGAAEPGSTASPIPTAVSSPASPSPVPAGTSTPSPGSPAESAVPIAVEPTLPPSVQALIPDDIFTRPADPLNLQISSDATTAVTKDIDPAGGSISAKGADGTVYTLTIPADDLAMTTEITMTPISQVAGIPEEAGVAHTFGVLFEPNGLTLGLPATLTITLPASLGTDPAAMLTFHGGGDEAGFQYYDQSDTTLTTSIDHFSGITFESPFVIDSIPPTLRMKFYSQSEAEERLSSEIASMLGLIRQDEILGVEPPMTVLELAQSALGAFKRLVISPRVAVADKSCDNATHAMEAYLSYQRVRQLLGVGDDPRFALVGAGLSVPAALVDLAVEVCFQEAYATCAATGDFPSLATYYLTFLERAALLRGDTPSEYVTLADGYLARCGRWRVHVMTTIDMPNAGIDPYHNEASREFFVQWTPGDGTYGMVGSIITGSGEVDQTQITELGACAPATIWNIHSGQDSTAEIAKIGFDHYAGPTLTGNPIPPVPTTLTLDINLGVGIYDYWCNKPDGADYHDVNEPFTDGYIAMAKALHRTLGYTDYQDISSGQFHLPIQKGWQFSTNPYRAVNVLEATTKVNHKVYSKGRLEVIVEHEPL